MPTRRQSSNLRLSRRPWDRISIGCMLVLLLIGVAAIHSAQICSEGTQWRWQIFWILLGAALYGLTARTDYAVFSKYAHWFYLLGIFLLFLVWTPVGLQRFGAARWIGLGPLRFQPSEFAKMTTIIMISATLARSKIGGLRESSRILGQVFLLFLIPWCLIFCQPDLGSALILLPIFLGLLYISNLSGNFFTAVLAFFILLVLLVGWDLYCYRNRLDGSGESMQEAKIHSVLPLKDYQRNRIIGFLAPGLVDPRGTGISWNLRQSLISIGSGGFWGKGYGSGLQAQLGYLPRSVSTNDFIFSVVGEEGGFLVAFSVLTLLILLVFNTLRIASLSHDRFGKYLAVAIAVFFLVHTTVNIGMTLGLMPITGVPLPFLSYGGSFLLVCCILQGIVQSIYIRRRNLQGKRDG